MKEVLEISVIKCQMTTVWEDPTNKMDYLSSNDMLETTQCRASEYLNHESAI